MKISIIRTTGYKKSDLREVFNILSKHEGPLKFHVLDKPLLFGTDLFEWEDIFSHLRSYRNENEIDESECIVLLTNLRNSENWFSSPNPEHTSEIFIHTGDWNDYIYCDSKYPIAFQVIENILQFLMFDSLDEAVECSHESPIGCVNDICYFKPEIHFKLRTADICFSCIEKMKEKGLSDELIKQSLKILNEIRSEMLFSTSYLEKQEFDNYLPFSIAITKRKMSMNSEPFKKFLLLIDHFDSIVRTSVLFMSTVLFSYEERLEFISQNGLNDRPPLGRWVGALKKLSKAQKGFNIPNDYFSILDKVNKIASEEDIVGIRNEKRGHGYIDCCNDGYKEDYIKYQV